MKFGLIGGGEGGEHKGVSIVLTSEISVMQNGLFWMKRYHLPVHLGSNSSKRYSKRNLDAKVEIS